MSRLDLNGGHIEFRTKGEGEPLVLLSTLSGSWMRQLPVLSKKFQVISYDMRGFGDSPSATGFPTNAEHADDLALLLESLGVERATVIGLSHGGMVAQHFAAKHGERLAGLGLVSTIASAHGPTYMLLRMLQGFLIRDDIIGFWEVLKSMMFSQAGAETLYRRESAFRRAMFDQYDCAALHSIYGQALEHDSKAWFGRLDCPSLVVGGQEDILFPPAVTRELADLLPSSRMELLPAAHFPPLEAWRDFNDLVIDTFGGGE